MAAVKLFQNLEPSFEDTKWKIKTTRGEQAEPLIDYIVLAEFDIDTGQLWFDLSQHETIIIFSIGSTVRHQYPQEIPGYKPDWFAEHMLPEGAHNREQDWTYMILNRNEKQVDEVSFIFFTLLITHLSCLLCPPLSFLSL
jgi:hypothetical protein